MHYVKCKQLHSWFELSSLYPFPTTVTITRWVFSIYIYIYIYITVITVRKWKARIAVENAESALKMKEIIGTVANGRAGLGLHPQRWWSNKQKKNGFVRNSSSRWSQAYCYNCRTKETGRMGQVGECRRQGCHMGWPKAHRSPKIKFPYKGGLPHFTNISQHSCLEVNYIRPMQSMKENCQPQTYSHWMRVCSKKLHVET